MPPRRLRLRFPRTIAVVIGCGLAGLLATGAEWALRSYDARAPFVEEFGCYQTRAILGGGYRANCRSDWVLRQGDEVVFRASFSSDAYGRRATPQTAPERRRRLALFTGCSFTAGQGVSDDETFAYHFGEAAPEHRVLNYGGSGFGPQHTLVQLERQMSPEEVGTYAGKPLLVYTMIAVHIHRAAGCRRILGTFGRHFPAYALQPDGSVLLEGSFLDAHPWRTTFARWMERSALARRLPDGVSSADIELTARLIVAARKRFAERFASDRFAVLPYPHDRKAALAELMTRLRTLGVVVLDPKGLFRPDESGLRFADGHPTPEAHRRIGVWLAGELRTRGWLDEPETP